MSALRRSFCAFLLFALPGLEASDAPNRDALAGEAFRKAKELQQAGQLPGIPPHARMRVVFRSLPEIGAVVTFPLSIKVEVQLPDAPMAVTFGLTKDDADTAWRLSHPPVETSAVTKPAAIPVVGNPALREELLARRARDQAVREDVINRGAEHPDETVQAKMVAIDAENVAWLKTVVAEHGLPGPDLVGRDGTEAAFLLVQHADLEFQQQMLPLVRDAYKAAKLSGGSYALLLDRVLVRTGKPQVYGTQTVWQDHVLVAGLIEDPDHLDERRAEVGLPPLAEYLRLINEHYRTDATP